MDIQQYILNNIDVFLPILGGNGSSQDKAVVITQKPNVGLFKWRMNLSAQCWIMAIGKRWSSR